MKTSKFSSVRWPIVTAALIALIAFVPYVLDLFTTSRPAEGYALPMTGILVAILIALTAIYPFSKDRSQEGRMLLIVAACILLLSFTGPKIGAIAISILAMGLLVSEVVGRTR